MADDSIADSAGLLHDVRKHDMFFAGGRWTLLGSGIAQTLGEGPPDTLADRAASELVHAESPIAIGALPFDPAEPAALAIPKVLRVSASARTRGPLSRMPEPVRVRSLPARADHANAVAEVVARIEGSALHKAVLARVLDLEFAEPLRTDLILRNLVHGNPTGYHFAVELPHMTSLLGSSPELLLARRGRRVYCHPLAGSARRSSEEAADRENAAALAASRKNRAEHAFVVDAVAERLRPFCRSLDVPGEPELVATSTMWHLGTPISGELAGRDATALHMAAALHPTPAVCGTPREPARQVLAELEPFDRGYYGGAVGWVDSDGDGEWAVAIRCAEVSGPSMRLYAGGGIVEGSDPDAELDETSAKFQTLLRAMGLELTA